jgi:predicted TIM-barrel enzyme
MLTAPYVFTPEEAIRMADVGADLIVAHMGVTVKGLIGAKTAMTLDEASERIQAIQRVTNAANPDALVLCHGGPVADPFDFQYVLKHTEGVVGFFGASSMERLPTESAMTARMREFTGLRVSAN